jgi:integrase
VAEVENRQIETSTKTERVRVVALPEEIRAHIRDYAISQRRDPNARVFCRPDGSALRHFHVQVAWKLARAKADVPGLRLHDLRHVGLTMLANDGMSLRSLMYRAGHTTVSAALVYQHRAAERNEVEASALSRQMNMELARNDGPVEGFSVGPLG